MKFSDVRLLRREAQKYLKDCESAAEASRSDGMVNFYMMEADYHRKIVQLCSDFLQLQDLGVESA